MKCCQRMTGLALAVLLAAVPVVAGAQAASNPATSSGSLSDSLHKDTSAPSNSGSSTKGGATDTANGTPGATRRGTDAASNGHGHGDSSSSSMGSASPRTAPASSDDCRNGGWKNYGFKNQGQCVSAVNQAAKGR